MLYNPHPFWYIELIDIYLVNTKSRLKNSPKMKAYFANLIHTLSILRNRRKFALIRQSIF